MQYPTFSLEFELLKNYSFIAGIDEVGRGCLAGPVVAGIVVLTAEDQYLPSIVRDSKTLSESQREKTAEKLHKIIPYIGIGQATPLEIDKYNIRVATYMAMMRAYWSLPICPDIVLMDGVTATIPILSKTYQYNYGDQKYYSIAAASIVAKVYRDNLMKELELKYPGYGFAKHKGYGTKEHYRSLSELGVSEIHRKTFLD